MPLAGVQREGRVRVRKLIELELMRLVPGEPLPPVRQLMKTHNVSLSRLQKALGQMQSEGLVERRARSGNFKAPSASDARLVPFVELVIEPGDLRLRPYHAAVLEALSEELSKRKQGVRLHRLEDNHDPADAQELVGRPDVRACVLLALTLPMANLVFARAPIVAVSLLPKHDPQAYDCPTVSTSAEVTRLQVDHLWDLGHRRIGFLDLYTASNPIWDFLLRREMYYRLMAERGVRVEPHWVVPTKALEDQTVQALDRMFARTPAPTAVIVSSVQLIATYRFLESRGLKVGRDVSVIGTEDTPETLAVSPQATTVYTSVREAASMSVRMLQRLWRRQPIDPVQTVTPQLIVRGSTAPPPSER